MIIDLFKRCPVKRTTKSADKGNIIGPVKPPSMKSKNFELKTQMEPTINIIAPIATAATFFVLLKASANQAAIGSSSEIDDVTAAKIAKKKKAAPIILPAGAVDIAVGIVWKKIPAPALKSRSLAKTIGKIAMPAIKATQVSTAPTVKAALGMLTFLGK